MAFFSIGGRVKNKRFDYIPQHYDPAVEDLKARMVKYGNPDISDAELAKARIRSGLRVRARGNKDALKEGNKRSNIRLLIVAVGLIISTVFLLQSDAFFKFIDGILT
jgi:hypothetical protein